jgi:hypothetical protein
MENDNDSNNHIAMAVGINSPAIIICMMQSILLSLTWVQFLYPQLLSKPTSLIQYTFKDMFKDLKEQGLQIQLRLTLIAF